jgi:hypothetical protein
VRPEVYDLFQRHVVTLSLTELRPALKALVLALLPALEEETAEDFERAFAIVEAIETKYGDDTTEASHFGFFWQTLFLATITSPTRRQGVLNYLVRRLPRFVVASPQHITDLDDSEPNDAQLLPAKIQSLVYPDPGLLVRCFVAGLTDSHLLVQRGFLDILVSHLPLHSPVLQRLVVQQDLDRLMQAVVQVLLRKEVSLNRRVWTWMLGPGLTQQDLAGQAVSPMAERGDGANTQRSEPLKYFASLAQDSLQRCILEMLSTSSTAPKGKIQVCRICLSLLDRWEIGSTILPDIFPRVITALYDYSRLASKASVAEVMRSASLFFDAVEAGLIWSVIVNILGDAFAVDGRLVERIGLVQWTLVNFNVRDEEMRSIHAPLTLLFLLEKLESSFDLVPDREPAANIVKLAVTLLEITSAGTFSNGPTTAIAASILTKHDEKDADLHHDTISDFYNRLRDGSVTVSAPPIAGAALGQKILQQALRLALSTLRNRSALFLPTVQLAMAISSRNSVSYEAIMASFLPTIHGILVHRDHASDALPISYLQAMALLLQTQSTTKDGILRITDFVPVMAPSIWELLSPAKAKHHVEAVRLLWQVQGMNPSEAFLEAVLLALMRPQGTCMIVSRESLCDAVLKFMVLWSHTVPEPSQASDQGIMRRGGVHSVLHNPESLRTRLNILEQPLLRVLDILQDPQHPALGLVQTWIGNLASVGRVFSILLRRLREWHVEVLQSKTDATRERKTATRNLSYFIKLYGAVLRCGTPWTWQCLVTQTDESPAATNDYFGTTLELCLVILQMQGPDSVEVVLNATAVLQLLIERPESVDHATVGLDDMLLRRMQRCLSEDHSSLQGPLLHAVTAAVHLRSVRQDIDQRSVSPALTIEKRSSSAGMLGASIPAPQSLAQVSKPTNPSAELLPCLRLAFASPSARPYLEQWVAFLSAILPIFADAIFTSLIPLVETLCDQATIVFESIVRLTTAGEPGMSYWPDVTLMHLLDGLEVLLARAHECLVTEDVDGTPSASNGRTNSLLSTGMFRSGGPPTQTAQANSRLTVILAFHDATRTCLQLWSWSNRSTEISEFDNTSAATTSHCAMRIRSKTRHLMEQMFSAEPLESLEVLIHSSRYAEDEAAANTAIRLLHIMQGARPKTVLPAILDSLCSRANPSSVQAPQRSTLTLDMSAKDVALFLLQYLKSTEDDAIDEIWTDCLAFVRDVLTNPLPFRQVLPPLVALVHMLAQKVGNTNFGEQRKMRKDLADVFQKLLVATFTTLPPQLLISEADIRANGTSSEHSDIVDGEKMALFNILERAVSDMESIVESSDRMSTSINTIVTSALTPVFHSKAYPNSVTKEILRLLQAIAKRAPALKSWRKDVSDAFNDPRFFTTSEELLQNYWFPVLYEWILKEKERVPDFLSRLAAPSNAGIMFGVGANAARLDTDRKTQLNLRRICLLLLAAPEDALASHTREFDEKLVELFSATSSSSPSSHVKADLFLFCRTLVLTLSAPHLSSLWPSINHCLRNAFNGLLASQQHDYTNLGILQACKLLDQLLTIAPDEFQLHEWLYIVDTVDAVYAPVGLPASSLAEQLSTALDIDGVDNTQDLLPGTSSTSGTSNGRQLLLNELTLDSQDARAMGRTEFAVTIVRPFFSQLSIQAYEGAYSMQSPDITACRRALIEDLLDVSTVVE